MLVSVQVVIGLGKPIVPWTILEVDAKKTFNQLFTPLQAGVFDCIEVTDILKRATPHQTYVGNKIEQLMVISSFQIVVTICSQFGKYVKLLVEMNDQNQELVSAQALTRPNAVDILMNSQRRMQLADNGLLFAVAVKNGKDRLFNEILNMLREMNVKWSDPNSYGVPFLKKLW